jgi:hypothetical protein
MQPETGKTKSNQNAEFSGVPQIERIPSDRVCFELAVALKTSWTTLGDGGD